MILGITLQSLILINHIARSVIKSVRCEKILKRLMTIRTNKISVGLKSHTRPTSPLSSRIGLGVTIEKLDKNQAKLLVYDWEERSQSILCAMTAWRQISRFGLNFYAFTIIILQKSGEETY